VDYTYFLLCRVNAITINDVAQIFNAFAEEEALCEIHTQTSFVQSSQDFLEIV
jgi:hypothetical protein